MKNLSKEIQLIEYIKKYVDENNYPPTVREMCKAVNVKSTSTIAYYLSKLENDGLIRKSANKNRALEVTYVDKIDPLTSRDSLKFTKIPVLGNITAGMPMLAVQESDEYFMVSPNLFKGEGLFMLNICGNSMINAGIHDGDQVILKQQSTANNGEIVAAMMDGMATVKRFYKENGHFRLQPENDSMDPIIVNEVEILGKVIGLVRKF